MPFLSKNLRSLLDFEHRDDEHEVDLEALSKQVALVFGDRANDVSVFLARASGKMKIGTLGVHLLQIIKHDSAVRDIQTTGHLAKFLSRIDVFLKTSDYRIIAMPNRLFDHQSQLERIEYFERGASLEMDCDLLDSVDAQEMMDREAETLERSSSDH